MPKRPQSQASSEEESDTQMSQFSSNSKFSKILHPTSSPANNPAPGSFTPKIHLNALPFFNQIRVFPLAPLSTTIPKPLLRSPKPIRKNSHPTSTKILIAAALPIFQAPQRRNSKATKIFK
jgi:hypothetical protein